MIFDIIIPAFLLVLGIRMVVKKDGAMKEEAKKYTPESVQKFSVASGIVFIICGAVRIIFVLMEKEILNLGFSLIVEDNTVLSLLISLSPLFLALIIILILCVTVLKKVK